MLKPARSRLFTAATLNAVFSTAIMIAFMHPTVVFGYRFPDLGFLAWLHLVPIVVAVHPAGFRRKLVLFFLAGWLGYAGVHYWILIAMREFGGVDAFTAFGALMATSAIVTVFMALPLALASWVNRLNRLPLFILLPTFMMLRDWFLSRYPFGGFPWMLPAYSQGQWLEFFQWVDVTGATGLSLYIYLVNGLIADGVNLFLYGRQFDKLVTRLLVVFVLSLFSLYFSSMSAGKFERQKKSVGSVKVALIQGDVSQKTKWDPYHAQENLQKYLHLTGRAVKNGAEAVFWPETAYPYGFNEDKLDEEKFLDLDATAAPLFFGAVVSTRDGESQYNAVLHVDTSAGIAGSYFKIHLVPFGEYLPYEALFGKLGSVVNEVGDFRAGKTRHLFASNGIKLGSLICFEDVFGEDARKTAAVGADVLVNYTNDAWYLDSSAQYQHLVFSQFRALENRRTLLRATNTGLTAVINPRGEVIEEIAPFVEGTLIHRIDVETAATWYTRHGEKWVWGIVIFDALIFVYTFVKWMLGPVREVN